MRLFKLTGVMMFPYEFRWHTLFLSNFMQIWIWWWAQFSWIRRIHTHTYRGRERRRRKKTRNTSVYMSNNGEKGVSILSRSILSSFDSEWLLFDVANGTGIEFEMPLETETGHHHLMWSQLIINRWIQSQFRIQCHTFGCTIFGEQVARTNDDVQNMK